MNHGKTQYYVYQNEIHSKLLPMLTVGTGFYVFSVLNKKLRNITSSHIPDKSLEFLTDIHLC